MKDTFEGKPWITKGQQRACKKKKKYLKLRTSEIEGKFRLYKNKLISIMRLEKKEYYNKILEESKHNIQSNQSYSSK